MMKMALAEKVVEGFLFLFCFLFCFVLFCFVFVFSLFVCLFVFFINPLNKYEIICLNENSFDLLICLLQGVFDFCKIT